MVGKSSKSDVQEQEPWSAQSPHLRFGFQQARNQFNQPGPNFFPFSTVAPFAPEQLAGMRGIAGRALAGSPLETAAQDYSMRSLSGDFLGGGNPHLQAVYDDLVSKVMPSVTSTFAHSGRTGSPLEAVNLGQELTRAYSPFAFDTYNQERTRQQQALAFAPQIAGLDYQNLGQLMNVGGLRQQQGQAELADAQARFDFEQNQPYNKLAQFMGLISGNYGGTLTQPSYSNPWAGLAGGLAAGAGIGMNVFPATAAKSFKGDFGATSTPWGAIGGAGLGGLLGLFGS